MSSKELEVAPENGAGMLCALDTHVLVTGVALNNELHAHWSASILIAGGAPFDFGSSEGAWQECRGVLVRPGTPQCMRSRDERVLVVHLDPDSAEYAAVGGEIEKQAWRPLEDKARQRVLTKLGPERRLQDAGHAREVLQTVLDVLGDGSTPALERDERVAKVCARIAAEPLTVPVPLELAAAVGLSASRLQHLFREQLGITLSEYARWQRIKRAGLSLQHGYSLTEAAHAGGFADSAHFSRTFRAMFGLPPSTLMRGSSAVQVLFAPLVDNAT